MFVVIYQRYHPQIQIIVPWLLAKGKVGWPGGAPQNLSQHILLRWERNYERQLQQCLRDRLEMFQQRQPDQQEGQLIRIGCPGGLVEFQRKQIVLDKTKALDYVKGGWLSKHTKLQRRDSTLYYTFFPHSEHLRKRRFLWSYYRRDCKLAVELAERHPSIPQDTLFLVVFKPVTSTDEDRHYIRGKIKMEAPYELVVKHVNSL